MTPDEFAKLPITTIPFRSVALCSSALPRFYSAYSLAESITEVVIPVLPHLYRRCSCVRRRIVGDENADALSFVTLRDIVSRFFSFHRIRRTMYKAKL
jgi:hypothetical protein